MKITFQNAPETVQDTIGANHQTMTRSAWSSKTAKAASAYKVELGVRGGDRLFDGMEQVGNGNSWMSQLTRSMEGDTGKDYRILMAHTMSEEDYGRLCQEGFPLRQMEPREAVTILDRIKAEVAKSGSQIAGYNDDLDLETLSRALGSDTLARAVQESFREEDLPLRQEDLGDLKKAWEMARALVEPTEGEYGYLIRSGMEPRIYDFYLAESAGAALGSPEGPQYYAEEIRGYYTQAAYETGAGSLWDGENREQLKEQMDQVILQAGYPVTREMRESAAWMLEQGLPLNPASLKTYRELSAVTFPVTEEDFAKGAAGAVLKGEEPWMGYLGGPARERHGDLYHKANQVLEQYNGDDMERERTLEDRRILEEIRLRMTAEVNVKLLRSGFAIDTAPMEELVDALRQAERQVAEAYFPGDEQSVSKYRAFQNTNRVVEELPALPVSLLGRIRGVQAVTEAPDGGAGDGAGTLSEIYHQGKNLQRQYEEAGVRYETMFTIPRADLGDRMEKALDHVDELLTGLGYEPTEENRKAVRVLGYNKMEVTGENLERITGSLHRVEEVVARMTPGTVLQMIRGGVNPLEKTLEELTEYFDQQEPSFEQQTEDYSHFLYRLEKRGDITPGERESFIGIYRLLHQVGKNSGAAVGGVVNMGAELNFKNLLAAARSLGFASMDVKLGEAGEAYTRFVQGDNAIDRQIEAQYLHREMEEVRNAYLAGREAELMLERGDIPVTPDHLLAAAGLLGKQTSPYGRLWQMDDVREGELANLWKKLDTPEEFQTAFEEAFNRLESRVEEEALEAESYVDVREKKTLHRELALTRALGERQEYYLPLELEGGMARLHLTLKHDSRSAGHVEIRLEQEGRTSLASLELSQGKVSGYLQGSDRQEVMKLTAASDIFSRYLKDESPWSMDAPLPVFTMASAKAETVEEPGAAGKGTSKELYQLAKLWLRAVTQKEVEYEN